MAAMNEAKDFSSTVIVERDGFNKLPEAVKEQLLELTPAGYIGNAESQAPKV